MADEAGFINTCGGLKKWALKKSMGTGSNSLRGAGIA